MPHFVRIYAALCKKRFLGIIELRNENELDVYFHVSVILVLNETIGRDLLTRRKFEAPNRKKTQYQVANFTLMFFVEPLSTE